MEERSGESQDHRRAHSGRVRVRGARGDGVERPSRLRDLQKGGTSAAKILAEEDKLRRSLECKANVGNTTVVEIDEIKTGESCLASSFTLLRPCVSGVESILRTGEKHYVSNYCK